MGTQGYPVSPQKVGQLLHASGYSLQATQKSREGTAHPDRNDQFEYLNDQVDAFHARGAPVISVDTKKKELVGDYTNAGREWHPQGEPVPVRVHDFIDDTLGTVIPDGVYDLVQNTGWVNVGIDHDTPAFAVESIARWWRFMGKRSYPTATELFITADAGGSNTARSRSWKVELQRFADRTGLAISVSPFPPGTSKWNKITASGTTPSILVTALMSDQIVSDRVLKQKVLAAYAAGLTEVIVPERNQHDLEDVPSEVRDRMHFHVVASVDEVLAVALETLEVAKAA